MRTGKTALFDPEKKKKKGMMWSCFRAPMMRRRRESRRNEFFLVNGALLLEDMIASCDGRSNPMRIFSSEELKTATNNYNRIQILCENYNHILYRGTQEDRILLIKKYEEYDTLFIKQGINEIVIASQINNHGKVLKLLGCCLETKAPVLVFEFPHNGTLSHRINESPMLFQWENRLRIAMEIADAITYLHMANSKPIIHRDINSDNIFLDEQFGGKLFGFGLSLEIPLGETYVDAEVVGTIGFVSPESVNTGRYTEKSDVFSFGAVLFELLTGNKAYDILKEIVCAVDMDEEKSEKVTEVYLNTYILKLGKMQQMKKCAELALRCVKVNPEKRPALKEVAQELRKITKL